MGQNVEVHALAWEPGGQRLASAGGDGSVRLWGPRAGRELARLGGHGGTVWALA
jgi:WD40 repeat protein